MQFFARSISSCDFFASLIMRIIQLFSNGFYFTTTQTVQKESCFDL